ncbi:hypothetical protein NRIC_08660 [Enterococcus florum]|uniref:DUF1538 domain-containing protein n=1 Tax=Enterococcus florum TaxID=2480627 RepID=A0A4P5P568_9ENTE|nr:DUF1538 domain-containing protein [Enterococcus florum]GCF92975.1 hypothetical protein NRIC_08660 [Enterococcus florum]
MKKTFKEVIIAILPMTILIVLLTIIFAPLDSESMISFLIGAGIMMLGMALFLFGADYSMMEVGDLLGKFLIRKRNFPLLVGLAFLIGIVITIAEPSVQVLAQQVTDISDGTISRTILIAVVSIGTGIFLVFAVLRMVFKFSYLKMMAVGYAAILVASFFTDPQFMPIAFDAGGVTTGPVTVPFILSFATGLTSMVRQGKNENDSFGMVGVSSLGPVLAVMLLGVIFR